MGVVTEDLKYLQNISPDNLGGLVYRSYNFVGQSINLSKEKISMDGAIIEPAVPEIFVE